MSYQPLTYRIVSMGPWWRIGCCIVFYILYATNHAWIVPVPPRALLEPLEYLAWAGAARGLMSILSLLAMLGMTVYTLANLRKASACPVAAALWTVCLVSSIFTPITRWYPELHFFLAFVPVLPAFVLSATMASQVAISDDARSTACQYILESSSWIVFCFAVIGALFHSTASSQYIVIPGGRSALNFNIVRGIEYAAVAVCVLNCSWVLFRARKVARSGIMV